MARGRTLSSSGQLFGEFVIDAGSAPAAGQPVMMRMRNMPYMPDYTSYPGGGWNLSRLLDWLKRLRWTMSRA